MIFTLLTIILYILICFICLLTRLWLKINQAKAPKRLYSQRALFAGLDLFVVSCFVPALFSHY